MILQALRGPMKIAIVHVRGHQKGTNLLIRGNNLADKEAREAALKKYPLVLALQETRNAQEKSERQFSEAERKIIKTTGAELRQGRWILPDGREIIPKRQARQQFFRLRLPTHWGTRALSTRYVCKILGMHRNI